ncbi:putative membrane protein [Caldalkalibacillus uzonensis]|uniref:Membrane protein n=1 Tax=Caldalkalibacillus uzonensis TaxID=353224 RepID=A0ABU0CV44_9BACI|nr:PH domain-containing protein [Caldalkalibacillus uzonensis]MDQ0340296.1 putative membrane protein [Caldalkalibacillus uzonensis]
MSDPCRLHPVTIIFQTLRLVKELFFMLIFVFISLVSTGVSHKFLLLVITLTGVAIMLIIAGSVLYWWRFIYYVKDGELRIEYGILIRKRRYIPTERIQSINLTAGIIHRLLGLTKVEIDTATSSEHAEATLAAVELSEAKKLQALLSAGQPETDTGHQHTSTADFSRPESGVHYHLPVKDLLIAASTSGSFGVLFSILLAVISPIDKLFPSLNLFDLLTDFVQSNLTLILYLVPLIALVSWLAAIIYTAVKYANFTLVRRDTDVYVSYGLLERREFTIPLRRIQAIRITENPLRQLFGLTTVYIECAGYGKEYGGSRMLYPLLRRRDLESFLQAVAPHDWELDTHRPGQLGIRPVPSRALFRYQLRLCLPVFLVVIPAVIWLPYGFLALLILGLASMLAYWQYKDAGWITSGPLLVLRSRFLSKVTMLIPQRCVQSAHVNRSFFQRRRKLASIGVRVLSGFDGAFFSVRDVDAPDGEALLDWCKPKRASSEDH